MEAVPVVPGFVLIRRINWAKGGLSRPPIGIRPGPAIGRASVPVSGGSFPITGPVSVDEVYRARRTSDAAEVAIKMYAHLLNGPREHLRFEQEVGALKALDGLPYLLPPVNAGVVDGVAYVVTPFCPGGSLHDHLGTVGRLTPIEVRRLGVKIAGALAAAHRLGIMHRGVKPANVLIDDAGEPQLADFGLVCIARADGSAVPDGARAFAAPEAYLPELMTASADIYSLGATLYTLLSGFSPRTEDPSNMVIDGDSVADLPDVPRALMNVIRQALALDPRDRPPDATTFGAALASAE